MAKKKKRVKIGKGKGSSFERAICKELSTWWTNYEREDVFWRTSGSGARATTRSKSGQRTFGQYGDVQATDPIGQPLIDLCTIEIKKGYSREPFGNLVEHSTHATPKLCAFSDFIRQVQKDARYAGSHSWLLITKRDIRTTMIFMPVKLYNVLSIRTPLLKKSECVYIKYRDVGNKLRMVIGMPLSQFFIAVKPHHIKELYLDVFIPHTKERRK